MGKRREEANRWHESGGSPIPVGQSVVMAPKAAWALDSPFVKCRVVEIDGVNQYPSQPTSSLEEKGEPSR